MKQNYLKELMTALLLLCCTAVVYAQDFEVDGIYYNILSEEDKTVEVTSGYGYTGAVIIPASVTYNSITYSVTSIGGGAFNSCYSLTSIEIPSSVTSIGESAFAYCTGLTSIEIPSSVTSIGEWAFYECDVLTSIIVDEGNSVYDSRNNCNAIIETASNTLIIGCKNTIIPSSVTNIGSSAFDDCGGLTSIEIPASVTSIGDRAFAGCSGLTSIVILEGVTSIGYEAFTGCGGLTSIEIPSSVTSIGENAFRGCSGLTSIEIPSSVTSIGESAFYGCTSLTSIVILEGVTSIGNSAFADCTSLTSIEIPSSVTSIGESAFSSCTGLTSIEIPSSVTSIGEYAFSSCTGLTSIEIPSSVTSIGICAFYYCTGLTSIEIPSSVTSIGQSAFYYCTGLTSIVVDEGNTIYDSRNNCNAIIETASNTLIFGRKNTIIPEGVTSIGNGAFGSCSGLTSIEIPASVTSIGNNAFSSCTDLTSIEIPASVTSIGENAFNGCSGLTSIVILEGVTSIGDRAFFGCSGLTSIVIPNGVINIGERAFASCSRLTSIEIPASVTSIGDRAFAGCSGLTSITSHIAAEDLFVPGYAAFGINKNVCTLYVPAGAKSTYAATEQWKDFTNIVETYDLTVTAAGYATMYIDKAVEIPAGVEAYTANRVEGDLLKMQAVEDVIPANTAVIIKASEGTYSFAYSDETPEAISDNLLRGTVADTYVKPQSGSVAYVLSMIDGVVGMYRAKLTDGTFKNNANRAYMLLSELNVGDGNLDTSDPGSQLSNGYRFDFSGTTAIESVETESTAPAVYYDLSGRRVENPAKGIYIVNGKKVYIK